MIHGVEHGVANSTWIEFRALFILVFLMRSSLWAGRCWVQSGTEHWTWTRSSSPFKVVDILAKLQLNPQLWEWDPLWNSRQWGWDSLREKRAQGFRELSCYLISSTLSSGLLCSWPSWMDSEAVLTLFWCLSVFKSQLPHFELCLVLRPVGLESKPPDPPKSLNTLLYCLNMLCNYVTTSCFVQFYQFLFYRRKRGT